MSQKSLSLTFLVLSLTLAPELAIGLNWTHSAQAGIKPEDVPRRGVPGSTAGGGSRFRPPKRGVPRPAAGGATRSSCAQGRPALTVLVPSTQVALTTEAHPTFFLYLPKTTAQAAEFVLTEGDDKEVYRGTIALPQKSGVVSVQLPDDAAPLQPGKDYQWYFNIVCQPTDRLLDVSVSAWIQRIEPSQTVVNALKRATPRNYPDIYAEAGIWQDLLTTLANLRRNNPNDTTLIKQWDSALKDAGLGQIPGGSPIEPLNLETMKAK